MTSWAWLSDFVMSSGFAGATAVVTAYVAYRGIGRRVTADRELAREKDARQRWWKAVNWVWDNREHVAADLGLDTLDRLGSPDAQAVRILEGRPVRVHRGHRRVDAAALRTGSAAGAVLRKAGPGRGR